MVAQIEVPDGVRAIHLVGQDGSGDPQIVLVDTVGRLVAVIYGDDSGTPRALAVDSSGQMITVPRGQSGNYLDVDALGYLTSVMKGLDGATLRSIAVDGSGHLIAVIQGDDGGTLRTAAVNADGRFQIVPYDPEDVWGNALGMGNAELASILTPCKRYDRRGNVIFWDSFEDGLAAWIEGKSGTGASVALSAKRAATGAYSVQLVGGSDALKDAAIGRNLGYPSATRHGIEASLSWGSDVEYIRMAINFADGTTYYQATIRYAPGTEDFEYMDSAGAWQDIDASKPLSDSDYVFHRMKLVVDVSAGQYVRALLDDEEYDLSGVAVYSMASGATPIMITNIYIFSTAGNNGTGYVDSVIITENEPS